MAGADRCPHCEGRGRVPVAGFEAARVVLCACRIPCPECGDTGFVTRDGAAAPCSCKGLRRQVALFNAAGIPARFAACTFSTFAPRHPSQGQARVLLQDWVRSFRPGIRGWLLWGPPGVGKTHLAAACVEALITERGVDARFVDFFHLLQQLKAAFGGHGADGDLIQPLLSCSFLVVDELGKGRNTEWENGVVDELISARYNAGRTTLFTSNHPPEGGPPGDSLGERLGERILSRLWELCTVHRMEGEDFRRDRR